MPFSCVNGKKEMYYKHRQYNKIIKSAPLTWNVDYRHVPAPKQEENYYLLTLIMTVTATIPEG